MQDLVYKGLPQPVRGTVWLRMVGNELNLDGARYRELLEECKRTGSSVPGVNEILLDLPRTHFNGKGIDASQLLPVLQAVSMLRPAIGYVQGMSYGALAQGMTETARGGTPTPISTWQLLPSTQSLPPFPISGPSDTPAADRQSAQCSSSSSLHWRPLCACPTWSAKASSPVFSA